MLMNRRKKVLVIGLDCAPPELVFEQWRDDLPHFRRVMDNGVWGKLESCIPAITVPAWSSMLSSKDPGTLGFYGFRNRSDYTYEKQTLANANAVKTDRVWDILSRAGKRVITVGVRASDLSTKAGQWHSGGVLSLFPRRPIPVGPTPILLPSCRR